MISICVATHNGAPFIRQQLESIICQIGKEDEIIISDDGSTDKTIEIISSFNDKRIKTFRFRQPSKSKHAHQYVCKNFENAIKQATGEYIFLADQDDWWMPNKVKVCLEALKQHTLVVHQAVLCDENLNDTGALMYKEKFVFKNFLSLKRGKYYGCTLAFRRELISHVLPFPNNLILHDQWIGCMAELVGNVFYEKTPLIKYRIHGKNTSGGKSKNKLFFKITYRINMFINLLFKSKK